MLSGEPPTPTSPRPDKERRGMFGRTEDRAQEAYARGLERLFDWRYEAEKG